MLIGALVFRLQVLEDGEQFVRIFAEDSVTLGDLHKLLVLGVLTEFPQRLKLLTHGGTHALVDVLVRTRRGGRGRSRLRLRRRRGGRAFRRGLGFLPGRRGNGRVAASGRLVGDSRFLFDGVQRRQFLRRQLALVNSRNVHVVAFSFRFHSNVRLFAGRLRHTFRHTLQSPCEAFRQRVRHNIREGFRRAAVRFDNVSDSLTARPVRYGFLCGRHKLVEAFQHGLLPLSRVHALVKEDGAERIVERVADAPHIVRDTVHFAPVFALLERFIKGLRLALAFLDAPAFRQADVSVRVRAFLHEVHLGNFQVLQLMRHFRSPPRE